MSTDLDDWIRALRQRVASGSLASLGPIDIGYGVAGLRADQVVQIMLTDLDDLDALAGEPSTSREGRDELRARRRRLLNDFSRLRELIG